MRTTDGGATWIPQNCGTTNNHLNSVSLSDPNTGTAVGEQGTILRTIDGGTTWISQNSGTTKELKGVSFSDPNTGTVVGGDGTILRTTSGGTVSIQIPNTQLIPAEYELRQNYPNPFNPTTIISYQLPSVNDVTLMIFDLLGREVITLVNKRPSAGEHEVTWDGRDASGQVVSSGIYIYRLQAGAFVQNRKMLLIR